MKNGVLISMLLMLISFSVFLSPLEEIEQYSFNSKSDLVISTVDTISDSDVITESVPTIIKKWHIDSLFPSTNSAHVLTGITIPFKFINHVFCITENDGFINVVQHQSNYLSL